MGPDRMWDLTLAGDAPRHNYTWGIALSHLAPKNTEYFNSRYTKAACMQRGFEGVF